MPPVDATYDVIIVGAGMAGCILAANVAKPKSVRGQINRNGVMSYESHDVANLLICDGSVIPRVASIGCGGTVATVTVFAAKRIIANHFAKS